MQEAKRDHNRYTAYRRLPRAPYNNNIRRHIFSADTYVEAAAAAKLLIEFYYLFPGGLISGGVGICILSSSSGLYIRRTASDARGALPVGRSGAHTRHHCLRTCGVYLHGRPSTPPLKLNYNTLGRRLRVLAAGVAVAADNVG